MLLQFDLNHINKVNFYPSNNNHIQALLVLLITNMISADNDDDDKHPLLMMMLKKMLIMPVVMNDRRDDDHRQIYGSTNAPQVPPKPRPTHLPVILAARCTIPHTLLCHILYCAAYCTGQPPILVTYGNRAPDRAQRPDMFDCQQT